MQNTNDKMWMNWWMHLIKIKTRRILLMSKYSDITSAPIRVQDEIYTIQTLLNILEVSESDFTTESKSNDIEINVTLIEEYGKQKNLIFLKRWIHCDLEDESEYIRKRTTRKWLKRHENEPRLAA